MRLDEATLRATLEDLLDERNALPRNILGGNEPGPPLGPLPYRQPGPMVPASGGFVEYGRG